jgi:hypothetical protein
VNHQFGKDKSRCKWTPWTLVVLRGSTPQVGLTPQVGPTPQVGLTLQVGPTPQEGLTPQGGPNPQEAQFLKGSTLQVVNSSRVKLLMSSTPHPQPQTTPPPS